MLFGMRRCRMNLPNRCDHLISRVARRAFEGGQAANRKGCAAMTRKTYCGNLLWHSTLLALLAPNNDRRRSQQRRPTDNHRYPSIHFTFHSASRHYIIQSHGPVMSRKVYQLQLSNIYSKTYMEGSDPLSLTCHNTSTRLRKDACPGCRSGR